MSDFDSLDELLDSEDETPELPEFSIMVMSASGGGNRRVALEDANVTMSVVDAVTAAQLTIATNYEFYVDGSQVEPTHVVGNGATITVIESVKGGGD